MLTSCSGELPNPHRDCVRNMLSSLVCLDHDLRRINTELRDVQEEYQREIDKMENKCSMLRTIVCERLPNCEGENDELEDFTSQLRTIDDVNECFKGKINEVNERRNEIINNGRTLFKQLQVEKCKLKKFHEATIEHLKRLIINTDDPEVVKNCEKDICQMQQLFMKDVMHIKNNENNLRDMFNYLEATDTDIPKPCCCFKEYDWLPPGKDFSEVGKIAEEMRNVMGPTLKKAYAALHVHKPKDKKLFLATYLFNEHHNEQKTVEKLNLFADLKDN